MKTYFMALLLLYVYSGNIMAQTINFELLDSGAMNSNCESQTDLANDVHCYSVIYTPGSTGTLTSYTLGFLGSCTSSGNPFIMAPSQSCVMDDATSSIDGCAAANLFLMTLSGNNGTTGVVAQEPIVIHQLCLDIPSGESVTINEDNTTGLTFSLNLPNGDPLTDSPTFTEEELESMAGGGGCEDSPICSVDFGLEANRLIFDSLASGNIVESTDLSSSFSGSQLFDLYDEENEDCTSPGGLADIKFDFQLVNTFDISGNGLIDTFAGLSHHLVQTATGIKGSIPFNSDINSNSSAGDVRGYSMEVHFENHIGVLAEQLTVHLEGMNTSSSAFESAYLVFYDETRDPYGTVSYNGYYEGENDLSGSCGTTAAGMPYDSTGTGIVLFHESQTVDLLDPCNPSMGIDGSRDNLSVSATADGGLEPMDVVSGFRLVVIGEDIATPVEVDTGSGVSPDDNVRGNDTTNVNVIVESVIKGISITGCVFQPLVLPVEWLYTSARSVGESVKVSWGTASEVNNDRYEVEWSRDGKHFEWIGGVSAKNEEYVKNEYDLVHELPASGVNYYRVKQIDFDGQYSYSSIASVDVDTSNDLVIYPNPVRERLYITKGDIDDEQIRIKIFNSMNERVMDIRTSEIDIDVSHLVPGVYSIFLIDGTESEYLQFVKL